MFNLRYWSDNDIRLEQYSLAFQENTIRLFQWRGLHAEGKKRGGGLVGGGRHQLQVKQNSEYQNKTPNLKLVKYLFRDSPPQQQKIYCTPFHNHDNLSFQDKDFIGRSILERGIILHLKSFIQIMLCIKSLWSARFITVNENEHFFATLHSIKKIRLW